MVVASKLIVTEEKKLKFVDIVIPNPTRRQVLIRGLMSGISHGTELALLNHRTPSFHKHWEENLRYFEDGNPSKKYPLGLGYEHVGLVVDIGEDINEIKIGDILWVDSQHQTYNIIDIDKTPYLLLKSLQEIEKAIFLALTRVALAGVHDSEPKIGDRFFVSGLGTVGLIVVQLLKNSGVSEIYASDLFKLRRDMANRFGAITFDPDSSDVGASIKQITKTGVDTAIECSGSSRALHDAVKSCGIGGKVITISTYLGGASHFFMGEEWHKNRITLMSSISINGCPSRNYPLWDIERLNNTAMQILRDDIINIKSLITHTFDFSDAKEAYNLLQNNPGDTIKVALRY